MNAPSVGIRFICAHIVAALLVVFVLFTQTVFADAPHINTFTVTPSTIHNGYTALFSWTGTGNGYTLIFECPTGVRAKSFDGSASPCGTRRSVSARTSVIGYTFTNVSGSRQTVRALLYPKDSSGTEYESAKAQVTLTVDPSMEPLTSFSPTPSAVSSGSSVTLTWKSNDVEGVNIKIGCNAHTSWRVSATSAPLTCGAPVLLQDLPPSGSISFVVTNDSDALVSVPVHLLPAIVPGSYDYARTLSTTLTVLGKSSVAAPVIVVPTTTPTTTAQVVTHPTSTATSTTSPSGIKKPIVASQSTTTLLSVPRVIATTTSTSASTKVIASSVASSTSVARGVTSYATSSVRFTRMLMKGTRHTEVELLQSFLASIPGLYPDNMITGYYGVLTEKAVQRFQNKYDIAHEGDEGFGIVGPKTRAQLNTLKNR